MDALHTGDHCYLNCVEIELNVVLSFVPRPFTTAIMAIEIPAAIRPYSMAVAPLSSREKALTSPAWPTYSRHVMKPFLRANHATCFGAGLGT